MKEYPQTMLSQSPSATLEVNRVASLVFYLLLKTLRFDRSTGPESLWQKAWKKSCERFHGPIQTTLHGHKVTLNFGYTYPINIRKFFLYNTPLVELVYQCYQTRQAPITLMDIGAAIGDTILLVHSNCPGMLGKFYCVDGDPEFFDYLQANLKGFSEGTLLLALLSDSDKTEKELVRTHRGTASAQGTKTVPAKSLDRLAEESGLTSLDVLKIDVDGFDGRVLLGAKGVLIQHQPAVIFEWHPILCERTGNDWYQHFEVLTACGYQQFIWFSKFGEFSHFMTGFDRSSVQQLAELCRRNHLCDDWHYDVIALPPGATIDPLHLAEAAFARARKVPL